MDGADLLKLAVSVLILVLTFTIIFTISFLIFGPTVYNPYDADFIEEFTDADGTKPATQPENNEGGYAYFEKSRATIKKLRVETSVQVVVLGDIGRSPRMQYHALSLANNGARVDLVGFADSKPLTSLTTNSHVKIHDLPPTPPSLSTSNPLLFLLLAPLKASHQSLNLYHTLAHRLKPSKYILIQNPPAIPTLLIAALVATIRGSRLVIDWHNFGWSIVALRFKSRRDHPVVTIARIYEYVLAKAGDSHFAVTAAMARVLQRDAGVSPKVLHDRPADMFQPLSSAADRQATLSSLDITKEHANDIATGAWRLVVSSTSWTADEDFSLLLSALVAYSAVEEESSQTRLPNLLVVITGKGPQQEYYKREIALLNQQDKLKRAVMVTAFLPLSDYASLLACADLGVSLHCSSSGLDLPMKVLDMFGSGLPVAGWCGEKVGDGRRGFEAWPELVREGENGVGFSSSDELARILERLFCGQGNELMRLRKGVAGEVERRWDGEWDAVARETFFGKRKRKQKVG